MKKLVLYYCAFVYLVSFLFISGEQTYSCVTSLENGTVTCSSSLHGLARALKDKKYLLENWPAVKEELMGLLDTNSHNYDPATALKTSLLLVDQLSALSLSTTQKSATIKPLLSIALTILVKGLQRPGSEEGKRTVEQYVEDLFSLYLITQKYNFNNFKASMQEELKEPTLPENKNRDTAMAYEFAKSQYEKARSLQNLLDVLTRDDVTLSDIYALYGKKFSLDKTDGENEPQIYHRCSSERQHKYNNIYQQQLALFHVGPIIKDLIGVYDKFKNEYIFGKFYSELASEYQKLVENHEIINNSLKENGIQRMMKLFGLNLNVEWPQNCGFGLSEAVIIHNRLIDIHDDIVSKLKIRPKALIGSEPIEYITPTVIREALNYNAQDYTPNTLCIEMGACLVDDQGQAINKYKNQQEPSSVILSLVEMPIDSLN